MWLHYVHGDELFTPCAVVHQNNTFLQRYKPGACHITEAGVEEEGAAVIIEPFNQKHPVNAFCLSAPPAD